MIAVGMVSLTAAETVQNGSFETFDGDGIPAGWSFRVNNQAPVSVSPATPGMAGEKCLRIVNLMPEKKPQTYGVLMQMLQLQPDVDYTLTYLARGNDVGQVSWAIGKGWTIRNNLTDLRNDWQEFSFHFKVPADRMEGKDLCGLRLVVEGGCRELELDDVRIVPRSAAIIANGSFEQKTLGDLPSAWKFRVSGGAQAAAKVDNSTAFTGKNSLLLTSSTPQKSNVYGVLTQTVKLYPSVDYTMQVRAKGEGKDVNIAVGTKWAQRLKVVYPDKEWQTYELNFRLADDEIDGAGNVPVNIIIDDLTPNVWLDDLVIKPVESWKTLRRNCGRELPDGGPLLLVTAPEKNATKLLSGNLLLANVTGNAEFSAELTDNTGKKITRSIAVVRDIKAEEVANPPFLLGLDGLALGDFTVDFKVNGKSMTSIKAVKTDLYEEQLQRVAAFGKELERLQAMASEYPASPYLSAPLTVLGMSIPKLQRQLLAAATDGEKSYYAERSAMVEADTAGALADLADRLAFLKQGGQLPGTWRVLSGPVKLERGWPVTAAVGPDKKIEERPVIFAGYGHFTDIDRDMGLFPKIGVNVVQVEIGPKAIFPKEGQLDEFEPDLTEVKERLLPLLADAQKNNIRVALLISPHYIPAWLLKKYPDMASSAGFTKYEVTHPKARQMLQTYLKALIPALKQSPYSGALHSICLANEPVYTNCTPDNPYSAAKFKEYMAKKYGPIEKFNQIAKQNFADYDAVLAAVKTPNPAARYVFYSFVRETFADWHRMLADGVKAAWPEMPVHVKAMVFSSPFEYVTGIDLELLGEFSDYNGNDNYFYRRGRYIADWYVTAMTHEMQISVNHNSVANTESHLIPDRETKPVANDHIYTANFQQFVTGASTLVTWVWADIDYNFEKNNPRHAFVGNIYLRPGNIIAQAMAGIDGVRLAPELRKFFDDRPQVAILYSPTALIQSPGVYHAATDALYANMCFTGYRVRFLSERQLAKGDWDNIRLLYVTGSPNLSLEALAGLEKFAAKGGKVVADAASLKFDQFGNQLALTLSPAPMPTLTPSALTAQITETVAPLPVRLAVDHPEGNDGLFFRMVPDGENAWLVNVVNYNFAPRHLRLEGNGEWRDLLRPGTFSPELDLAPLKPLFLRFTAK